MEGEGLVSVTSMAEEEDSTRVEVEKTRQRGKEGEKEEDKRHGDSGEGE